MYFPFLSIFLIAFSFFVAEFVVRTQNTEAPGWFSQLSLYLLASAQVMTSGSKIQLGQALHSVRGLLVSLPLSLCSTSPLHILSVSPPL